MEIPVVANVVTIGALENLDQIPLAALGLMPSDIMRTAALASLA